MSPHDGDGFGQRLRWHRMAAGLTQEELAERSGLSVRSISDIERGRSGRPFRASLERLADALRLPATERTAIMTAARQRPPAGPPPLGPAGPAGPEPPAADQAGSVPRQLPAVATHFAGRTTELSTLTRRLDQAGGSPAGTVLISAIGGTAGVGKTALAVTWAHQVAGRFPDGQLYVNLRGYDPGQPMTTAEALAGFLRALGVPGPGIPPADDDRAAMYRSLLAGRQVLVVLDNAGSAEQVRPLLPGSPHCLVVVTSRDALPGLVARDGAWRLDLDLLLPAEAVSLLRALIGARVDADPDATAALAQQCSRLPLALRVAAELAAARPDASLRSLVDGLADQRQRLDRLDAGGDPRAAVRAVFSWSHQRLDAGAARAFRLLSLHPGPDFDCYAAAALTGSVLDDAVRVLGRLAQAHLLQPAAAGRDAASRYGMHDLLRAFGADLAAARDSSPERQAALGRLLDYYLHVASAAMDTLFPAERGARPRVPEAATAVPPLASPAAARAWLDTHRASLASAAMHAASRGWPGQAILLAAVLNRYLEAGEHQSEAVTIHSSALLAASSTDGRLAAGRALNNLGLVSLRQGRYQEAASYHARALSLFREIEDRTGEAQALGNLGLVSFQEGGYQQAIDYHEQALVRYRQVGDQTGEGRTLTNLGLVGERQGRYPQAAACHEQALALFRETGNRAGEAYPLVNLGNVRLRQGRCEQAEKHYQQALALHREHGSGSGEAYSLSGLGDVSRQQGRCQQAADYYERALPLLREHGDRSGEAAARNGLGEALRATGQHGDAAAQHAIALGLAGQIGDTYEEARAHLGLARTCRVAGDRVQNRRHLHKALARYASLGAPEASEVRADLAMATSTQASSRAGPAAREEAIS
jgi:tetratricopeptide (TPR) repeat protein